MAGGLERNIINLANHFVRQGHKVALITFDKEKATPFYYVDSKIKWYKLGKSEPHRPISFINRLILIHKIRAIVRGYRFPSIICFHHGILLRFFLGSFFLASVIIVSERNSLSLYDHIKSKRWNLNFLLMYFVKHITIQFPSYSKNYPKLMQKKLLVIPNPVTKVTRLAEPSTPHKNGRFILLSVGRLCSQKNFECLIKAFKIISSTFPKWDLHLVGDGAYLSDLKKLIKNLSLENRIVIHQKTKNISLKYLEANLFCLPSKWEGFPNTLAEAQAHGLPVIGFEDCCGVRDLIKHNTNGLLSTGNGDSESLARSMKTLMAQPESRKNMGARGNKLMAKYDNRKVFKIWDDLLLEVFRSKN